MSFEAEISLRGTEKHHNLQDSETGEELANPYIKIWDSEENKGVYLNSQTFYSKQKSILKLDKRAYERFPCLKNKKFYQVFAVTGVPHCSEKPNLGIKVMEGFEKDEINTTELGLISEKRFKKKFPTAYCYLSDFKLGFGLATSKD